MRRVRGRATAVGSVIALAVLTLGTAVLSVTTAPNFAVGTTHSSTPGQRSRTTSCGPPRPGHAWAVEVSATGKIRWRVPLTTHEQNSDNNVMPVVAGKNALFARDGSVHAIEQSDGRSTWSWTGGQTVYGMWVWKGVVAALTDQVSDSAHLTGLDARTGAVRWHLSIPGNGLLGTPEATGDGGLAWLRTDGALQVVDLASGRVRWSLPEGRQAFPVTADGLVLAGRNGVLHALADQSGQTQWTASDLHPMQPDQVVAGLILVTSGVMKYGFPTYLIALDPATDRVVWRFDPGTAVAVLSAGPAGLAVSTDVPGGHLYLLDPRTGGVVWQTAAAIAPDTVPIVLSHDIVSVERGLEGYAGTSLVDRDISDGQLRWNVRLPGPQDLRQPVLHSGSLVVVEASGASGRPSLLVYDQTTGQQAWRVVMPEFVQIPPVSAKTGFLVQAATPDYACALSDEKG